MLCTMLVRVEPAESCLLPLSPQVSLNSHNAGANTFVTQMTKMDINTTEDDLGQEHPADQTAVSSVGRAEEEARRLWLWC